MSILNTAAINKLKTVGIQSLTKSNTINTAPISGRERVVLTNQGIERKVKAANSTKPIPLGRKGVLSKTEITVNNTINGTKSNEMSTEKKLNWNARNSKI